MTEKAATGGVTQSLPSSARHHCEQHPRRAFRRASRYVTSVGAYSRWRLGELIAANISVAACGRTVEWKQVVPLHDIRLSMPGDRNMQIANDCAALLFVG